LLLPQFLQERGSATKLRVINIAAVAYIRGHCLKLYRSETNIDA
jgi:hypothetical protein